MMIERASGPKTQIRDREQFINSMEKLIGSVKEETFKLSKVQIGDVLTEVFNLVRKHRVPLETYNHS